MFPARGGDCTLITLEDIDYRILIDGGFKETFRNSLAPRLKSLGAAGKGIDLLVVTHVDNDHIMGIIQLFRELDNQKIQIEIRQIWYNSYRHLFLGKKQRISIAKDIQVSDEVEKMKSFQGEGCMGKDIGYPQGETLAKLLSGTWEQVWNYSFEGKAVSYRSMDNIVELRPPYLSAVMLNPGNEELYALENRWNIFRCKRYLPMENGDSLMYEESFEHFLSYADSGVTNQSSIAFLLRYTDKSGKHYQLLFLGDASTGICLKRLKDWENIRFDCLKLPHHGSQKNITKDIVKLLHVNYILFSTDGRKYGHPDWDVVSAVADSEKCKKMVFNYDSCTKLKRLKQEYPEKKVIVGKNGYCKLII